MMTTPKLLMIALTVFLGATGFSQEFIESRSGRFSASIERTGSAKVWPESNAWHATVKDENSKVLHSIQKDVPYDFQFPAIYVSDLDGSAVVIASAEGLVEWYSPGGSVVAALYPFGSSAPDYERVIKCSIGGDRVALLISSPEMHNPVLHLTDLKGGKLREVSLANMHAGEVFLSASRGLVLAGSYVVDNGVQKGSYLLNANGELVRTFPMLFRYADIDEEEGIIVMADRNTVMITNMDSDASVEFAIGERSKVVTGVHLVGQHALVTVESIQADEHGIRYIDPSLMVLDSNAAVIGEKKFDRVSPVPLRVDVRGDDIIIDGTLRQLELSKLISR